MFSSLFGRKKEEPSPIPSHDSAAGGDDYMFVERKEPADPGSRGLFPSLSGFQDGLQLPGEPSGVKAVEVHVSYLRGVPFKLSAELCAGQSHEELQLHLDKISAQFSDHAALLLDYDFTNERSLVG